ncbi:hypothetical protein [Dyella japonica]|uniref:Uncharacterized protein n=1 Tax=Dyella japonica TaxID=231455 RepID=A0ABV2JZ44_9GAMM
MSQGLTEIQKLRIDIAAKIVAAQLPEGYATANRAELTGHTKEVILGAVRIANEIIDKAGKS